MIKKNIRDIRRYFLDTKNSWGSTVKMYNTIWKSEHDPCTWLREFIISKNILPKGYKHKISIFSVNGSKMAIKINNSKYKLFVTGENVHVKDSPWEIYEDLLIEDKRINLSIGFDFVDCEKYVRFPLWLMYMFSPKDNFNDIDEKCRFLNNKKVSKKLNSNERNKFCSFLCKNDYFGDRIKFIDIISEIDRVDCDSDFMHNNDDLKNLFNDNKLEYLKQYKFNLCPENSNCNGYVTEKIFEAIHSGCVPIYWGSLNDPEPEILNHKSIIFLEPDYSIKTKESVDLIKLLNSDKRLFNEFRNQDRFVNNASSVVNDYYIKLENSLKRVLT